MNFKARFMASRMQSSLQVAAKPQRDTERIGSLLALTTRSVQEAFAAGLSIPFLRAAHAAEKRIYARAGFSVVGEILHISYSKSSIVI